MARDRKAEYARRNSKAQSAGFRNYYQFRKYTERFRHGLKDTNVTRIPRAKRGENIYEIAAEHRRLFTGEHAETEAAQRERLNALRDWLVDTTGYWTVAQWEERYRPEGE